MYTSKSTGNGTIDICCIYIYLNKFKKRDDKNVQDNGERKICTLTLSNAHVTTPPPSWNEKKTRKMQCVSNVKCANKSKRLPNCGDNNINSYPTETFARSSSPSVPANGTNWNGMKKRKQWFTQWAFNECHNRFFIINLIFTGQCMHWFDFFSILASFTLTCTYVTCAVLSCVMCCA